MPAQFRPHAQYREHEQERVVVDGVGVPILGPPGRGVSKDEQWGWEDGRPTSQRELVPTLSGRPDGHRNKNREGIVVGTIWQVQLSLEGHSARGENKERNGK